MARRSSNSLFWSLVGGVIQLYVNVTLWLMVMPLVVTWWVAGKSLSWLASEVSRPRAPRVPQVVEQRAVPRKRRRRSG